MFTFTNNSDLTELQFFFSPNASAADNDTKITVLSNETVEGTVAEAGWETVALYLIVKNSSAVAAEFDIQLMESVVG